MRVRLLSQGTGSFRLEAFDPAGVPVLTVASFANRPLDPAQLQTRVGAESSLFTVERASLTLADPHSSAPTRIAAVGDLHLREGLRAEHHLDLEALLGAIEAGADVPDVLLMAAPVASRKMPEAAVAVAEDLLGLLQQFLAAEPLAATRLVLVTEGALAAAEGEVPDPCLAPALGLLRSAVSEHPGRFCAIDLDGSEASLEALPAALRAGETELALRDGRASVARLAVGAEVLTPPPGTWRLDATKPGTLESLALVESPDAAGPLGPGEVRVQMQAGGLNFRDVMIALGLYPDAGVPIGSEGAGLVVEVGPEVTDFTPGERVMGLIPNAFAPLARADGRTIARVPANWSFEQAAAVPIAFLTASYALGELADLRAGERVLIHRGAGGVGMAAIQLAQGIGADVFATASPGKWKVLEELGIPPERIASSRDLDFEEKFLQATGDEGVDVVLNSLAGDFVDASLRLLPRGGRFLELGKTDVRAPNRIAAVHPGVSYRAFDLTEAGPERIGRMLTEVLEAFAAGELRHYPISTRSVCEAPAAFRLLREGANVGKLVLTP
ncbi:MAG TPA: zinc-binding dehydrogenase, partial [Solirubrobacterales bacterium]